MEIRDKKGRFVKGSQLWQGKHHTKATKEKIRKARLGNGKKWSEESKLRFRKNGHGFKKGHPLFSKGFTGKFHTQDFKNKLSERNKRLGIKPPIGIKEKNPNWKGGISREPYDFNFGEELKNLIKKRDGYKCKLCKKKLKVLYVHHIDYNKQNSDPKNLLSLCNSCHSKTNYGRKNWTRFFKNTP
jgi:5-methylcytosine-specific restriction endonuclease McrA